MGKYHWCARVALLLSLTLVGCMSDNVEQHILAVGGVYVFDRQSPCKLVKVEPQSSIKHLDRFEALAFEASSEGVAEVACGEEQMKLEIVLPTRLEIELVDKKSGGFKVGDQLLVHAKLYDRRDRELDVGKLTKFEWNISGILELANNRSSGEFGFCDTCYGGHGFRVTHTGKGTINSRLGEVQGQLQIEVVP